MKPSIDEEKVALLSEIEGLRALVLQEWQTMSWQVATEHQARIRGIDNRLDAINRAIARRKRKTDAA